MGCNCGKPKCDGQCGCKSPAVLQINNPPEYITFHKVSVPAAMGDSTTNPPAVGEYKNVLLYYEADQTSWLYSTDGIPTKLTNGITNYEDAINLPQINGHTLIGNQSSSDLGLQGELTAGANIQINGNIISATDTTYTAGNGIELDGTEIKAEIGDGLEFGNDGEINIANIEQYAHFFDTVADMKSSTNLIDGSYARTLGYYAKNDGGGATYKIRNVSNDDVVDEATIIEMGDGSDELIAELIIEEPINVKTLGVYGDGTHDDYSKIQHAIDIFHHHTLFFPDGTYLITQPLAIGTANAEQVDLKLDSSATIKSDTAIDSLLEIGKYEGQWERRKLGSIVTIDGGNWDATNCQRAIYTTSNRKNSILKNLNIYNVSHYGIYAVRGTNTSESADLNVDNVMINGTGSEGDSAGLYLECYDNKIRNVRVNKCTIGVYDRGGSFFENVHCLASWTTGSLNQTNYEKTIGFKFQGGGVSKLSQCYADTFGIGFEFNTPMKVYLDNCQSYHYLTNLEYKTILFKDNETNANLRLCVSDFDWTPPSVTDTGKNVGLDLSATNNNFRTFLTTFKCFRFRNFNANEIGRTQEFDYIWCHNLHDNRCVTTRPAWTVTMQKDKYYPIAILASVSQYNLQIGMANDQMIEASFMSGTTPSMTIKNIRNYAHANNYTLALCNTELIDGVRRTYLCIKSSTTDTGFNPSVTGFDAWNNQYIARPAFVSTPLDSPTVVAEASFNP